MSNALPSISGLYPVCLMTFCQMPVHLNFCRVLSKFKNVDVDYILSRAYMEKQETEMKRKLEIETGNGNWKQKCEQKTHQSLVQYFLHSVLIMRT